jgi:hypothetical protein
MSGVRVSKFNETISFIILGVNDEVVLAYAS